MFFSVIIPTFNRLHTLKRAIESVQDQSFRNFEMIVVDDGSTDNTGEYLRQLKGIKVLTGPNRGVSHARNWGVENAQGEWLAFLDSDDKWLPDKLQKQYDYIQQNDVKLVHGEEIWIRNGVRVNPMKKHKKDGGDQFEASLKLCAISPSTVVMHRKTFLELWGFREDFEVCEDYDLWLKYTSLYSVGFVEDPLIQKFGGHEDQLSRKFKAMDYWRVKSLYWIIQNRELPLEKFRSVMEVLMAKCEILLRGYIKHNNRDHYQEILSIFEEAKQQNF